ncbi:MAG: PAS domain-containing protein [Gammaproteobacteria bacterium]|nr:PAS domain-containing protein [Gammaproteobacteria bacterium]
MKKVFYYLVCLVFVSVTSFAQDKVKEPVFSKVFQVMYDESHEQYVITDNGVWQVIEHKLVKIDTEGGGAQSIFLDDYKHLFPKGSVEGRHGYDLASLGFVMLLIMFSGLYLYYQSALNRRRKAFYERIKVQQQILSIAFLATEEEVLDCDMVAGQVERLNKNANFSLPDDIYFQSKQFIDKIHPEDSNVFVAQFESLISGSRDNYELNYRVLNENSEWKWVSERGMVIERDASGKAQRLVSSMRDITSIKYEQEQLHRVIKELESRLRHAQALLEK